MITARCPTPEGERVGERELSDSDCEPMECERRPTGAVPRLTFDGAASDDGSSAESAASEHEPSDVRIEADHMVDDSADDSAGGSFADLWKQLHAERHQAGMY